MTFVPSPEQQAIFDAVLIDNVPALAIEALAGTGKTTVLVQLAQRLPDSAKSKRIFCAFNKSIVEELQARLSGTGMEAKTFHQLGYAALRTYLSGGLLKLEVDKYKSLVRSWMAAPITDEPASTFYAAWKERSERFFELPGMETHLERFAIQLLNWVRIKLIEWGDTEAIDEVIRYYRMTQDIDEATEDMSPEARLAIDELIDVIVHAVPELMAIAEHQTRMARVVDYTDQIYWVVRWQTPISTYEWTFVDECLPYLTPVQLTDGTAMPIGEIVEKRLPVKVLAYDIVTGEQRHCEVTNWSKTLNQKPLVKIKARWTKRHKDVVDSGHKGHPTNFVVCTVDHKVWANGEWIPAGAIQPGMIVQVESGAIKSQAYKITTSGRETLSTEMGAKNHAPITKNNRRGSITVRGGNGRGMTLAQSVLLEALGDGWSAEYVVKTGMRQGSGYPTSYKVDIANPERMIAVEVDGRTHHNPQQKQRDKKKQALLESLGWTVLRFSNRACIQSTQQCVQAVNDDCPLDAVVVSVEPVSLPDNFVYDITVADCHNFYANGILVHNCQDLNPMQREMVARVVKKDGGRIVLVGDPHQAIYEFAGADGDSFALSVNRFNAKVLPLTLTRRCAKLITRHAAQVVPAFRCPDEKPEGSVIWIEEDKFLDRVAADDMVLCRMRAPLVKGCLQLLALGRPAMIQGADIGKALIGVLNKLEKHKLYKVHGFDGITEVINAYRDEQVSRAYGRDDEELAARIADECEAISELIKLTNPSSMQAMRVKLDSLFSSSSTEGKVVFTTVHKAKGLEAKRVFIIAPKRLPLIFGKRKDGKPSKQRPESIAQEHNLDYVARTRAIETLVYVVNKAYREKTIREPYIMDEGSTLPAPAMADNAPDDWDQIGADDVMVSTPIGMPIPDLETVSINSPMGEPSPSPAPVVTAASPVGHKQKLMEIVSVLELDELDLLLRVLTDVRNAKAAANGATAAR